MNPEYLRSVADHLWQSTLCAGAAGLLTLFLRTNHARVRYRIWVAASCKFLIPLSLLIAVGGHLAWRTTAPVSSGLSSVAQQVGQPFAGVAEPTDVLRPERRPSLFPGVLLAIWMAGSGGAAASWWIRWRRIRETVDSAQTLPLAMAIPVKCSSALREPGVFGVFRPVLLLPEGIFERLTPAQLQAVIEHELCHFRNRDNLTAVIQMLVETIFWFHPLVWWIGKQMVWERERACDEDVLQRGNEPRVYAEGILNVCKLYMESPLTCVAGVTGADLKRRIEAIMAERLVRKMNWAKSAMLGAAAAAAIAGPIALGVMHAPMMHAQAPGSTDWQAAAGGKMAFEVASIKLDNGPFRPPNFPLDNGNAFSPGDRFSADFPLTTYTQFAYKVRFNRQQIEAMQSHGNLPKWAGTVRFAIEAKAQGPVSKDQMRLMMQSLLADRFHLAVHFETQETPALALTLVKAGKTGAKLRPHSEGPPCDDLAGFDPAGPFPPRCYVQSLEGHGNQLRAGSRNTTMDDLAEALSGLSPLGRPIVNQTGISGTVDYDMQWTREPDTNGPNLSADAGPTFLQAVREQLGLKLEPAKAALRVLVIDHVERPSEN